MKFKKRMKKIKKLWNKLSPGEKAGILVYTKYVLVKIYLGGVSEKQVNISDI